MNPSSSSSKPWLNSFPHKRQLSENSLKIISNSAKKIKMLLEVLLKKNKMFCLQFGICHLFIRGHNSYKCSLISKCFKMENRLKKNISEVYLVTQTQILDAHWLILAHVCFFSPTYLTELLL